MASSMAAAGRSLAEDDLLDVHRSLGSTASRARDAWLPDLVPMNPGAWLPELVPLEEMQQPMAAVPGMPHWLAPFPVGFDGAFVPEYSTVTLDKDHRPAANLPPPKWRPADDRVSMCKCPSQLCARRFSCCHLVLANASTHR